jgi:hypothetical protein
MLKFFKNVINLKDLRSLSSFLNSYIDDNQKIFLGIFTLCFLIIIPTAYSDDGGGSSSSNSESSSDNGTSNSDSTGTSWTDSTGTAWTDASGNVWGGCTGDCGKFTGSSGSSYVAPICTVSLVCQPSVVSFDFHASKKIPSDPFPQIYNSNCQPVSNIASTQKLPFTVTDGDGQLIVINSIPAPLIKSYTYNMVSVTNCSPAFTSGE